MVKSIKRGPYLVLKFHAAIVLQEVPSQSIMAFFFTLRF